LLPLALNILAFLALTLTLILALRYHIAFSQV